MTLDTCVHLAITHVLPLVILASAWVFVVAVARDTRSESIRVLRELGKGAEADRVAKEPLE